MKQAHGPYVSSVCDALIPPRPSGRPAVLAFASQVLGPGVDDRSGAREAGS